MGQPERRVSGELGSRLPIPYDPQPGQRRRQVRRLWRVEVDEPRPTLHVGIPRLAIACLAALGPVAGEAIEQPVERDLGTVLRGEPR